MPNHPNYVFLCFVFLASQLPSIISVANERPNVVFILADDLGWRDLSNEGSEFYESPHIDRIATNGLKFTKGYATCQVCSPSRASIMTGKYPARLKITDWIGASMGKDWARNTLLLPAQYELSLSTKETTIAESFRNAGYKTFFAGKWHLGGKGSLPEDHGFETNIGGHHAGSPPGGFFAPYNNPKMESGPRGEYLPIRLGNETANWIEENRDQPFFAFLSFYAVHAPIQTTENLWRKYREKADQHPPFENRFKIDRTLPVRQTQDHPLYAGLVESMDEAVGLVLRKLDQLNLTKNTIVVFTSDNGGVAAGDGNSTSNLPLRGGKGRQWEGGIREPFYIWIPNGKKGVCDAPVIGTDFYPTLLDACRLPKLEKQHVDGISLFPLFSNAASKNLESKLFDRELYWHYPHYGNQGGEPSSIIRHKNWKLILYHETNLVELYDLQKDPSEQNNVAQANLTVAQALRAKLNLWLFATDANMPSKNPNFDLQKYEQEKIRIKEKLMPYLEKQHASFLNPEFTPKGGWWEQTGN